METLLTGPANAMFFGIPMVIFSLMIPVFGTAVFAYIMAKRMKPLVFAAPDERLNQWLKRTINVLKIWLAQYRQPRYLTAGIIHIAIFFGFLVLSIRSFYLVVIGISEDFVFPGLGGSFGPIYCLVKDYAATFVLIACFAAAYRRLVVKPARYAVPEKYGHDHTGEALFVLALISVLMLSESAFEAAQVVACHGRETAAEFIAPMTLPWFWKMFFSQMNISTLQTIHIASYYIHDLTFFFFLCFLPFGKHFHVVTSLFNVYFMRLRQGHIKPVRHGVSDEKLDDLESFGVKQFEDFTWKHILDFYSCADCGRCSDNCPANAVGRPLSPRFISIKGRNLAFAKYPLKPGKAELNGRPIMGNVYEEDEIWSCTTCGACEQECPLGIEYIDKIVDLRRGMVDEGVVPQSLQKPLSALEKRGNPWGKLEKKRVEWVKELGDDIPVKVLNGKAKAQILYFVDSVTSFDDRMQSIGQATATLLYRTGADFGILGKNEKDSGHEVRRFGEEMLFQDLRAHNMEMIASSGVTRIVTADPHAYNALKNDYENIPPVEHISQYLARKLREGTLKFKSTENSGKVYTYHDPCYLGRHNAVYEDPRMVLDAIPGLKRVDMKRCRDRSFCCGGGGLMLFYEPEEEERMGVLRVKMAADAGADVIVTACPFCLVNIEDAIKVAGLEGRMEAIDLAELAARQLS
jgi:Fe-S oxidoreductase